MMPIKTCKKIETFVLYFVMKKTVKTTSLTEKKKPARGVVKKHEYL